MNFDPSALTSIQRARLHQIKLLIDGYDGAVPFHQYLKKKFSQHRNFGSRDRTIYRSWSYAWFRCGKAFGELPFEVKLFLSYYLCHGIQGDLAEGFRLACADLEIPHDSSVENRLAFVQKHFHDFSWKLIFPFDCKLSDGLLIQDYAKSMLVQPNVFVRVRETGKPAFKHFCESRNVYPGWHPEQTHCAIFPPGINMVTGNRRMNRIFEIQDLSSQMAGAAIPAKAGEHWWDCCCGAGGKSLQLLDRVPGVSITATDIRSSILQEFSERLAPGHSAVAMFPLNVAEKIPGNFEPTGFDGIIADVPCTGSGTWSRNPENLTFFDARQIDEYVMLQKKILLNCLTRLKTAGCLVYITCSVFKAENEEIINWLVNAASISVEQAKLLDGTKNGSDSMFYAVCRFKGHN